MRSARRRWLLNAMTDTTSPNVQLVAGAYAALSRGDIDAVVDDWEQHYNALAYRLVTGGTLMQKVLRDATAASVCRRRPTGCRR